ncbi:MAG TPA: hypothetical protein PKC28_13210 [Bdellovibrionales bacterium]|nr:hypothetical protein [Bdellovibrionales bacterium]
MQSHQETKTGGEFHKLTQLEGGEKYTLLLMNDFGIGAIVMQITLTDVKVSSYAQYAESVQLTFKPKGKRTLRGYRFYGSKSCAIWKGWLNIDTNPFQAPTISESGLICRQSRYLSFDRRYMTDAIAAASVPPLFSKID